MTARLLASIKDADEADVAAGAGFDIAELRLVESGEVHLADARRVRQSFPGLLRIRWEKSGEARTGIAAAISVGADQIAMRVDDDSATISLLAAARSAALATIAVVPASPQMSPLLRRLKHRIDGVMLDADGCGRLVDRVGIADLSALAEDCRSIGMPFGFSGELEPPDVARLLLLEPDVLGFDDAMRDGHASSGRLLPDRLATIRALIPREGAASAAAGETLVRDTIFVRDFVVQLSVGAYRREEGARQRVRFSVEAVTLRRAGPPRDMRDVFSYDVILETIRVLAERAHVAFVETLAEDLAASLLTHAAVESVDVRVEKLDIIDGGLGIAITRRRP